MKLACVVALLVAVAAPADAAAKGVSVIVVVGAEGRSIRVEPEHAVLAVMLYHPASVYDVRPEPAQPRGGYVRLYPLGDGGFPAVPGRFYPATGALCFGWDQAVPRSCGRLGQARRLLAAAHALAPFAGPATVLREVRPGTMNLAAAVALALDRHRESRPARRPARCVDFVADWVGPGAVRRPARICISPGGVYARGRLYRAEAAAWRLANDA